MVTLDPPRAGKLTQRMLTEGRKEEGSVWDSVTSRFRRGKIKCPLRRFGPPEVEDIIDGLSLSYLRNEDGRVGRRL